MSLPDLPHPFAERLHALVTDAGSVADLRRYFGIDLPPGAAGARFEALGGGGDRPAVADAVTAEDLIAVQALSVTVPAAAVLDLLEGHVGTQLSTLLRAIPRDLDMADATEADLAPSSPAHKAWHLLRDQPGIGWVTAGNILARKRPRLLPVYGGVVRCAVGRPGSFWHALHSTLRADDCALQRELLILRKAAGIPETVSALRVCDVVVWMRHRLRQPSQQQRRVRTVILARKHEGAGLSESVDVEDFGTTYRFRAADDSYTVEPLVSILRRTRRRSACE
ncbi:DUF6308 family protein [Streptomyces sp900116325]|uniref:DUF6308 family protein n=1 Tax=Streptomyces sp. 900116325 TaxID=3154295 RepID=UPI0033BFA112